MIVLKWSTRGTPTMMQYNFAESLVEGNLGLDNCEKEPRVYGTLYRQLFGCLRFVCHSRQEIAHSVGLISRFMSDPRQSHLVAAKRILRYLRGTSNYGVLFPSQEGKSFYTL